MLSFWMPTWIRNHSTNTWKNRTRQFLHQANCLYHQEGTCSHLHVLILLETKQINISITKEGRRAYMRNRWILLSGPVSRRHLHYDIGGGYGNTEQLSVNGDAAQDMLRELCLMWTLDGRVGSGWLIGTNWADRQGRWPGWMKEGTKGNRRNGERQPLAF